MLAPAPKLQLEPSERGGLLIWEMPVAGQKYVVGVDTAHGLAKGDFAVAVVIEAKTCTLVARWKERCDPHIWGQKAALLAWFYNEAILAVETFPSAHGVTAVNEAMRLGYKNVYLRATRGQILRQTTNMFGWHTNSTSKPEMIDRAKRALEDQSSYIPDEDLLQELRTRSWNVKGQMEGPGHDDIFAAYAIALMVRDESWRQGKLRTEEAPVTDPRAQYWIHCMKQAERNDKRRGVQKKKKTWVPPWKSGTVPM